MTNRKPMRSTVHSLQSTVEIHYTSLITPTIHRGLITHHLLFLLCILLTLPKNTLTQGLPLGGWQVHQPFKSLIHIDEAHGKILGTSEYNLFSLRKSEGSLTRFSKSTGLSESSVTASAYDKNIERIVVGYQNGNIDIIYAGKVVNIPDIKQRTIIGDKSIYHIFIKDNIAWLSTGFGIVSLNLDTEQITNTFIIGNGGNSLKITGMHVSDTAIVATTAQGLRVGSFAGNKNLSDFNNWKTYNLINNNLPVSEFTFVTHFNNTFYISTEKEIYRLSEGENEWELYFTSLKNIQFLGSNANRLFFIERDGSGYAINALNTSGVLVSKTSIMNIFQPNAALQDEDGNIWVADFVNGIVKLASGFEYEANFFPNAPFSTFVREIEFYNGKMYVAVTELPVSQTPTFNEPRIFTAEKFNWESLDEFTVEGISGLLDITAFEFVPEKNLLVGISHQNGIFELDLTTRKVVKKITSSQVGDVLRLSAITTDLNGNIWITNSFAAKTPLICRKKDGTYVFFENHPRLGSIRNTILTDILADDQNKIWISSSSVGILVLDYNESVENTVDDLTDFVLELPNQSVLSMEKDLNGEIWIGTQNGVAVVYCSSGILDRTCGATQVCVPRNDGTNFCDNLLNGEFITAVHVDPGNRKWFGTTNGAFLVSADGLESIYSFNQDNSPLLSNDIRSVAVDKKTGDVFFGTSKGIISFRAEATSTDDESGKPIVIPNPVRPDYFGPIAIRNLPDNGIVKILDSGGYLVWESRSIGGQAIWDGKNANGQDVKSGVYFVLAASDNGKEKARTKIAVVR